MKPLIAILILCGCSQEPTRVEESAQQNTTNAWWITNSFWHTDNVVNVVWVTNNVVLVPPEPELPPGYKLQSNGPTWRYVCGDGRIDFWHEYTSRSAAAKGAWEWHRLQLKEAAKPPFQDVQ